jgi:hypothetical protein
MDAVTLRYEGRDFMRQASGTGPFFGHYRFVAAGTAAWVALLKSWPTEQLACDDAIRAAHFAIDAENYGGAATRAVEAAALVMTLNRGASGWPAAVQAQRVAANARDFLEARLVGAKERHWPDLQIHSGRAAPLRAP